MKNPIPILVAEHKRRKELNEKLEALTDPTLIDRMYCDHLITVSIRMIDELTPKLQEISNGLK